MSTDTPSTNRLPDAFVVGVLVVSCLPAFMVIYGSSAGLSGPFFESMDSLQMSVGRNIEGYHAPLPILEWMTFALTLTAVGMGLIHLSLDDDMTPLILGATAVAASTLDAGHTLMASTLTGEESGSLVQMTWGICRAFTFILLILGSRVALDFKRRKPDQALWVVAILTVSMLAIAGGVLQFCSRKIHMTSTLTHAAHVARVWNLLPFFLIGFAYITVFRPLDTRCKTPLTHAALLSLIPQTVAQVHLASSVYSMDSIHYFAANFLEMVAFALIPIGTGFVFACEFTQHSGVVTEKLRGQVAELQSTLYAERSEMDNLRLKLQREASIRENARKAADQLLDFYHNHPRLEIFEKKRITTDEEGIAVDGQTALEQSPLEAVLPQDLVNILKYCLQKAQHFLKERQHEIEEARRVLGFKETTQARTEDSKRKLWAFYQNHPQPAVEFAVDGTPASYNDAAFQLMRKLGKGSLNKLAPGNMVQIVRSCLKEREQIGAVDVPAGDHTLVWAFFPDPDSRVVFGYLVKGAEVLQPEPETADETEAASASAE